MFFCLNLGTQALCFPNILWVTLVSVGGDYKSLDYQAPITSLPIIEAGYHPLPKLSRHS